MLSVWYSFLLSKPFYTCSCIGIRTLNWLVLLFLPILYKRKRLHIFSFVIRPYANLTARTIFYFKELIMHSKIYRVFIITILTIIFSFNSSFANDEITFLNWAQYMDPDLISEFEKATNIKVKEVYFKANEVRDKLMTQTNGLGYDLVMVNAGKLNLYKKQKWLAHITKKQVPNLKNIDPRWWEEFKEAKGFAVPYSWGTLGIAYRSDLVKHVPNSWMDLFKPKEELKGKILMTSGTDELIGTALKALGHSLNSENREELAAAEALLLSQKPYVKNYGYLTLDETSGIVLGDIIAAQTFNGDALALKELNENIEYITPKEGTNIWSDYIVVMNSSRKKEQSYQFINFLNQAKNAAKLAEYIYYATPNYPAHSFLSKEFLNNTIVYPDDATLSGSELFQTLQPLSRKLRNQMYSRIMR